MRKIWAICLLEMRRVFKKPASYALMFGMPLLFTFIFGSLVGNEDVKQTKLAVIDLDHSSASDTLIKQLANDATLSISLTSMEEAKKRLHDKQISAIIQIPAEYQEQLISGQKQQVLFQHGPNFSAAPVIRQLVENNLAQIAVQAQAAKIAGLYNGNRNWQASFEQFAMAGKTPVISVVTNSLLHVQASQSMNNMPERAVGFSIMFVMISLLTVSGVILEARQSGVWYRMLAAPASRFQVLCGYMLSFFVIGWIQFAVLMGISYMVFGVHWGNLVGQAVLVSAFLLCVVGLGLFIAGLVRTKEQQNVLANILIVSTCMLGGVYWPLDAVSKTMQRIAEFVPQTWAMRGFTELIARGGTIMDISGSVTVLLGFAVVFMLIGVSRVRFE